MYKTALHLTDLHLEHNSKLVDFNTVVPRKIADYAFLTGDIAGGLHALPFIKHLLSLGYIVFYVLGNHEHYSYCPNKLIQQWRTISAQIQDFYFLENESIVIDDIEIFGATLWTSLGTKNVQEPIDLIFRNAITKSADFSNIDNWMPEDMQKSFYSSFEILKHTMECSQSKYKIVLSHHAPSFNSIHPNYSKSIINNFFATELGNYISYSNIDFWFHGHVHDSADYLIYLCRVICNPFGYIKSPNPLFSWKNVVEIKKNYF